MQFCHSHRQNAVFPSPSSEQGRADFSLIASSQEEWLMNPLGTPQHMEGNQGHRGKHPVLNVHRHGVSSMNYPNPACIHLKVWFLVFHLLVCRIPFCIINVNSIILCLQIHCSVVLIFNCYVMLSGRVLIFLLIQ